jgi:hypothetical protein
MTTTRTPELTRTRQTNTTKTTKTAKTDETAFTAAGLVDALEQAWTAIRDEHPDVPAAVVVVASGTSARGLKYGHYAAMRWQHGQTRLPEVLVSGEGLRRSASEVLTTLLHEAAHGLADARGIKDTSRQGRWHNRKFAALADELGLDATKDPAIGWSPCTLRADTNTAYADTIDRLVTALSAYRHPEPARTAKDRTSNNNAQACACGCPRRIRVAASVLDEGPITCGVCGEDFTSDNDDTNTSTGTGAG